MAHWAELDENNIVIRVTVGDNDDLNGDEGYQWLIDNLGGRWIKTSYNASIRSKFASIGFTYNEELDVFIEPKPYPSWSLNTSTFEWEAPTPLSGRVIDYAWKESSLEWVKKPDSGFWAWDNELEEWVE